MAHDVVDLHGFYRSRQGQWTRRAIREQLCQLWPDTRTMRILGVGYAAPYLRPFLGLSERVLAFMPAPPGGGALARGGTEPGLFGARGRIPAPRFEHGSDIDGALR